MRRALIATSMGVLVLAGCSPATGGGEALGDAPVVERTTPPPAAEAPETLPPEEDEPGVPHTTCSGDDRSAIDAVIAGQLEDFAAGDYARALEHATTGFREDFTPESFRDVIQQGFPSIARDATHRMRECVTIGDAAGAQALVTVTSSEGERVDLVYLLSVEDGAWLIAGATPVEAAGDDEDTVTV